MAIDSPVVETIRGRFFAEGSRVLKEGDAKRHEDGSRTLSLTYPVCDIWEHLQNCDDVAQMVADALNAQADLQNQPST